MGNLHEDARINRRRFLRVVGFTAGGAVLSPLLAAAKPAGEPQFNRLGRLYRGTQDGKLLGSADGQAWTLITDFGPHLAVSEVKAARDGWLLSTLVAGSQSFVLKSRDGKTWYTQDYVAPGQA